MRIGVVRPIALCVFRDESDRILVLEGYDPTRALTFYRRLGGGIEFGERSQDTVAREIREELGAGGARPGIFGHARKRLHLRRVAGP